MPKPKPSEIDKEIKKQDEEVYGDTTVGGHQTDLEKDDDSEEALERVLGNKPEGTLAEEVNKDEISIIKGLSSKKTRKKS